MGVKSACKQCNKPKQRLHYQNNQEKYKDAFQNFMKRNSDYLKKYPSIKNQFKLVQTRYNRKKIIKNIFNF